MKIILLLLIVVVIIWVLIPYYKVAKRSKTLQDECPDGGTRKDYIPFLNGGWQLKADKTDGKNSVSIHWGKRE